MSKRQKQLKKLTKKESSAFQRQAQHRKKKRVFEEMGEIQHENLKTSIADQSGENSRYSYHLGDTASLAYGREFSMGLANDNKNTLNKLMKHCNELKTALMEHVLSQESRYPIERLQEVPVAKYSVKGKEILEKRKTKKARLNFFAQKSRVLLQSKPSFFVELMRLMRRQFSILCGTLFFAHAFLDRHSCCCFSDSSKTYVVHDSKRPCFAGHYFLFAKNSLKKENRIKSPSGFTGVFLPFFCSKECRYNRCYYGQSNNR